MHTDQLLQQLSLPTASHSVTWILGGCGVSERVADPLGSASRVSKFLEAEAGFSFGGNSDKWPQPIIQFNLAQFDKHFLNASLVPTLPQGTMLLRACYLK